jgi:hypothetical protein
MSDIQAAHFKKALLLLLDEAFARAHGFFLDPHDSLFETLGGITAEQASIPVGGKCATLSAQVRHVAYYFDLAEASARNPDAIQADWGEIWRTTGSVTPAEWLEIQTGLRGSYERILQLVESTVEWPDEIMLGNAMALVAHTAYHLGEIEQVSRLQLGFFDRGCGPSRKRGPILAGRSSERTG